MNHSSPVRQSSYEQDKEDYLLYRSVYAKHSVNTSVVFVVDVISRESLMMN